MKPLLRSVLPGVFVLTVLVLGACGTYAPAPTSASGTPEAGVDATEGSSTQTSAATQPPTQPGSPYGLVDSLDRVETPPDGLVFYGTLAWTDPMIPPYGASAVLAGVTDANGKEITFGDADPGKSPADGELRQYWAYKLNETDVATPVKLSMQVKATLPADGGSFTFDPGASPKVGQQWDVRQDVTINAKTIHVLSAQETGTDGFFVFTMQSDSDIVGATITDLAHPPLGGGGGTAGPSVQGAPFPSAFGYQTPLPQGPFTFTFTDVQVLVPGDWGLTWAP
jgi:hypothetical protein